MPSAARQTEQQLAKASSVTSLAPKPKGKAAKGAKGKVAAAKGRKGGTPKKGNRVVWDSVPQKRRPGERASSAGRQFASAAKLHQVGFRDLGVSLGRVERSLLQRRASASWWRSTSCSGRISAICLVQNVDKGSQTASG